MIKCEISAFMNDHGFNNNAHIFITLPAVPCINDMLCLTENHREKLRKAMINKAKIDKHFAYHLQRYYYGAGDNINDMGLDDLMYVYNIVYYSECDYVGIELSTDSVSLKDHYGTRSLYDEELNYKIPYDNF